MSRQTNISRPKIKYVKHSGDLMNNAQHRIVNDIINIETQSTTDDTGVQNISNYTANYKCKLRQKKLLRHESFKYKVTEQDIHLQNQTYPLCGNYEEDYLFPINLTDLEIKMKNLGLNSEFDDNKSESNEKTDQDLQGNDELNVAYCYYSNDYDCIIEPTYILDKNEETAETRAKEQNKIEILENIIIKPATFKWNDELLQVNEIGVLNTSNHGLIPEEIEAIQPDEANGTKQSDDDDEQVSVRKDEMSKLIKEIISKKTENNAKAGEIEPIASTSKGITHQNTRKTKDSENGNFADRFNYPNTEKVPQLEHAEKAPKFDNFKVPKKVKSKKIKVKKEQPRFVLTHVVDGYIIQESNFAFPIMKHQGQMKKSKIFITEESAPTEVKEDSADLEEPVPPTDVKEEVIDQEQNKTIEPASDTAVKDEIVDQEGIATVEPVPVAELTREIKEKCVAEETVAPTEESDPASPTKVKDEEKEFKEENVTAEPLSPAEVKEEMNEEVPNEENNPFARVQQSTVKSWTAEDLLSHLQKFNWHETAAFLEDNEIDGASLFMVTKSQLIIIGINEEQADVICEFIQSGSSRGN